MSDAFELADSSLIENERLLPEDPKRLFGSKPTSVHTQNHVEVVRGEIEDAAEEVFTLVPRCPERTLALRNMEQASFYATAALVREGAEDEKGDGGFVEIDRRRRVRERVESMVSRAMTLAGVYLCENQTNAVALVTQLAKDHSKKET